MCAGSQGELTVSSDEYDFSFQEIVEQANDTVIITDTKIDLPGPKIIYVNAAFTKHTGYSREEVIGLTPRILQGEGTSVAARRKIRDALSMKSPVRVPIKNYTKAGQEYWSDLSIIPLHNLEGEVTHFAAIQREITEQKRIEDELNSLSKIDSLTGVRNRRGFDELLTKCFRHRYTQSCHLMMVDIDNFKWINDSYGHQAGDRYLMQFVQAISDVLRDDDVIARVGGEEFCICLTEIDAITAEKIASRICEATAGLTLVNENQTIKTTVSIGISHISEMDTDREQVVKRADNALYKAKRAGKNRFIFA